MHQDQSPRIHLRQKSANFLLAQRRIAIAEKHVDVAFHLHIQAGHVSRIDPWSQPGGRRTFVFAAAKTLRSNSQVMTRPKPFAFRPSASRSVLKPEKVPVSTISSGFTRFYQLAQKIENLDFGAHRIVHVPTFRDEGIRASAANIPAAECRHESAMCSTMRCSFFSE